MLTNSHDFAKPAGEAERTYLEALIRADYDRCRVGETFDDMKGRMAFSREDRGLYRDWMAIAVARAEAERIAEPALITAE
ncbi:hypothetical protein [Mesorhizobium sp. A623]